MTCRRQKQVGEQGESPDSHCSSPEDAEDDQARHESSKKQLVCESAMSPEIAIVDAETESNCIEVGDHRAQHASHPNALANLRSIEAGADA